jgi:hypothetical protein
LHTTSGANRNFQFVLHAITPIAWSAYSSEQKYNELFFIYLNILNYADKTLSLKSLAIQLVDNFIYEDELNYKLNALAFIQSLKTFCGSDDDFFNQINSLKKVYICLGKTAKQTQLKVLKGFLSRRDYLNINLDELNLTNEPPKYNTTTELAIIEPKRIEVKKIDIVKKPQEKCAKCGPLATKLLLKEADRANCRVDNCDICKILLNIINISKDLQQNSSILCINCAIETLIDNLKSNLICACCYRSGIDTVNNENKICNLHSICDKCIRTTQYGNIECKFCLFNKFSGFLKNITRNNLFEKHDRINCSYDFCDLSSISANDDDDGDDYSASNNDNTPTVELTCGHSSCFSIRNPKNIGNSAVCTFCIFKKIFEMIRGKSQSHDSNEIRARVNKNRSLSTDDENDGRLVYTKHERGLSVWLIYFLLRFTRFCKLGQQPEGGKMDTYIIGESLPGFSGHKTIVIEYNFPDGVFLVSFDLFYMSD